MHEICTSRDTCQFSECPHRRILVGRRPYTNKTYGCRICWKVFEFLLMLIILILLILAAGDLDDECGALEGGLSYLAIIITAFFIVAFMLLLSYIICSPVTRAVDATLCILAFVFLVIAAIILFIPRMSEMLPDEEECRKRNEPKIAPPAEHEMSEYSYLYDDQGMFDRVGKKIKPEDMNDFDETKIKCVIQNLVERNGTRKNNGSSKNDTIVTLKSIESGLVMKVSTESSEFRKIVKVFDNRQKENNTSRNYKNYSKLIRNEERVFPSHLKRKLDINEELLKQYDPENKNLPIQQPEKQKVIKLQKQIKFLHKETFQRKHRDVVRPMAPPWTPHLDKDYFIPAVQNRKSNNSNDSNNGDSSGTGGLILALGILCLVVAIIYLLDVFRMGFCDMYY